MTSLPNPLAGLRAPIVSLRTGLVAVGIALVALLAVAIPLAAQAAQSSHNSAVDDARTQLRKQAGDLVAQVMSVNTAATQADRDRIRKLVAGDFAAGYGDTILAPPPAGVAAITWRPVRVAVARSGADWGQTLLAFDVTTQRTGGSPSVGRRTVAARLEKLDGAWRLTRAEVVS